jgi:hypothetical protein
VSSVTRIPVLRQCSGPSLLSCTLLTLIGAVAPPPATAFTSVVPFYETAAVPSNASKQRFNTLGIAISCYDDLTLRLIACPYSYELVGVDDLQDPWIADQLQYYPPFTERQEYGGHEHDQSADPFYWSPRGALSPIAVDGGPFQYQSPTKVTGNTFFSITFLTFFAPGVAGTIWERTDIGSPPNWYCDWPCFTRTDSLFHVTYFVGYQGLDQLSPAPSEGSDYVVVRNPDTAHPDANAT